MGGVEITLSARGALFGAASGFESPSNSSMGGPCLPGPSEGTAPQREQESQAPRKEQESLAPRREQESLAPQREQERAAKQHLRRAPTATASCRTGRNLGMSSWSKIKNNFRRQVPMYVRVIGLFYVFDNDGLNFQFQVAMVTTIDS